jgi:hypothetical protein
VQRGRERLDGRVVWNVNSTAQGGGVAEMLVSPLAYARGAGIDALWVVIAGNDDFSVLTKRIHNYLHGSPGDLDGGARRVFDEVTGSPARTDQSSRRDPPPLSATVALDDVARPASSTVQRQRWTTVPWPSSSMSRPCASPGGSLSASTWNGTTAP